MTCQRSRFDMFSQSGLLLRCEGGGTAYFLPFTPRSIFFSCLDDHLPCSQAHCLKRTGSGIIGISDKAMVMMSFLDLFARPGSGRSSWLILAEFQIKLIDFTLLLRIQNSSLSFRTWCRCFSPANTLSLTHGDLKESLKKNRTLRNAVVIPPRSLLPDPSLFINKTNKYAKYLVGDDDPQ